MTELFPDRTVPLKTSNRNRDREGAIKSKNSFVKHDLITKAVKAQIAAYRNRHDGRIALIDGNAGDGEGVFIPEEGFFAFYPGLVEPLSSSPTAELLMQIAEEDRNADVILCERDPQRRAQLTQRFPLAQIISNNAQACECISSQVRWALWVSDPCGPSGHGHEAMASLAKRVPIDFVIALNEGWINGRLRGTETSSRWALARERYLPMANPQWWRQLLCRKYVARTHKLIRIAPNFRCRIMVVADYLSQGVRRKFEVIT